MKLSRFAAASAVSLALLLPAASVWAQGTDTPAATAPKIDPAAKALLVAVDKKAATVRSLSAQTLTITSGNKREGRASGTIQVLRPNYLRAVTQPLKDEGGKWVPSGAKMVNASNGKAFFMLDGRSTYRKMPAAADGANVSPGNFPPLYGFFTAGQSFAAIAERYEKQGGLAELSLGAKESWMGAQYDRVQMNLTQGASKINLTLYVGSDKLIHRVVENIESGANKMSSDYQFLVLKVNAPLAPATFAYAPPAGYKEFVQPERPALLAVGTPAPDFTAKGKDGADIKLSDLRGKVVVLDFWATWCGPCISSFPHTGEVAKKMADKAVVFALNVWDEEAAYNEWLPKNTQYSHFVFAIDPQQGGQDVAKKLYKVSGIPTQYVIDKNGIVRAVMVGFGGPTDALEKAIDAADKAAK